MDTYELYKVMKAIEKNKTKPKKKTLKLVDIFKIKKKKDKK